MTEPRSKATQERTRTLVTAGIAALLLASLVWWAVPLFSTAAPAPAPGSEGSTLQGDLAAQPDDIDGRLRARIVAEASASSPATGVRGRVVAAADGRPLADVEVVALRRPPSLERLWSRVVGLLRHGMWTDAGQLPEVLGRTTTDTSGRFELLRLAPGRVYLDARSSKVFVRTPRAVRVARGEVRDGIELLGVPAGALRGQVFTPVGSAAAGARLTAVPGINKFFVHLTQRTLRWFDVEADAEGRFSILGVPAGDYVVVANHPSMALLEEVGVEVRAGETTTLELHGRAGAEISGVVLDPEGAPATAATVSLIFADEQRALFSSQGRSAPWPVDRAGRFRIPRVASGRVAIAAHAEGLAPSPVQVLYVVDDAPHTDLVLELQPGDALRGRVVDGQDEPLADAVVSAWPVHLPTDADVTLGMLKIRKVTARSDADGAFAIPGLDAERLVVRADKPGYATAFHFGARLDDEPLVVRLMRGATVRGRVVDENGEPKARYAVQALARPRGGDEDTRRRGPLWAAAFGSEPQQMQFREGKDLADFGIEGDWVDVVAEDGRFSLDGVPPGRVRVRVRVEGSASPDEQYVDLLPGAVSPELEFVAGAGITVSGRVVDAESGAGVPGAQVTGHRAGVQRRGLIANLELEDFDFLGLSANSGRRSALTGRQGEFAITGIEPGRYRFVARHPDRAKSAGVQLELVADETPEPLRLELGSGGAIAGRVTGAGRQPVEDALVVALSLSAGAMKGGATDARGRYRIEGLTPGQYVVFKSRIADYTRNVAYDLLGNMRLKTAAVRAGRTAQVDIHDAEEGTVRVYGVVRDGGQPVANVMVSALSHDAEGILGMGVRAQPTDDAGAYELVGMKPGRYYLQVTRFMGRRQQADTAFDIPEGVAQVRVDLDLPQSVVRGHVLDADGQPVGDVIVQVGVERGAAGLDAGDAPSGLLGVLLQNNVLQVRSASDGSFALRGLGPAVYRVVAAGRRLTGARRDLYGDAIAGGIAVDGVHDVDGLQLVLPQAGEVRGTVIDGSGLPVAGAEVHYEREDEPPAGLDLFGIALRPARTDAEGAFVMRGVTPGRYRLRADLEGSAPGLAEGVVVREGAASEVVLQLVRGATLRIRVTNMDGSRVPDARVTVLDGSGRPLARKVSVASVFRRLVGNSGQRDSGWYEIGDVPPDTYTIVVTEEGHPELRVTRDVRDGEVVEWVVDMVAELERAGR